MMTAFRLSRDPESAMTAITATAAAMSNGSSIAILPSRSGIAAQSTKPPVPVP
jgi:hypothetical protein